MWHYASAYRLGTSHLERNIPCQDYCVCEEVLSADETRVLIVAVSDGAGSATHSDVGATVICHTIKRCAEIFLSRQYMPSDITPSLAHNWSRQALRLLESQANAMGLRTRDLAATCLGMVIWPDRALCWQLGDGAMVVDTDKGDLEVCFWPMRGEHANETNFLIDDAALQHIEAKVIERSINQVAAFTDGIQMVVLHYASRTASSEFFQPHFTTMQSTPPGTHEVVNNAIGNLISQPAVLARTDDDRSLVLAVRKPPILAALTSIQRQPTSNDSRVQVASDTSSNSHTI